MSSDETKCPFCGSATKMIETPYIDMHGDKQYTYCCLAQKKNAKYVNQHQSRWGGPQPDIDDVSKF